MRPPLLVFTDLDGTLIDHDSYRWDAAQPALAALRDIGAGVILASSKTAQEISALRDELDLANWPAIVENGAGLLPDGGTATADDTRYSALRTHLDDLPPELRHRFRGFGDMTVDQVAQATGLALAAARQAKARQFSEPGTWSGTKTEKHLFLAALAPHGITAREGGRFLTLSFGGSKADRIGALVKRYRPDHTLSLGDAPNDIEMLQATDHGVIVANPHRTPLHPLPGEDAGRITRTRLPGPAGWNQAVNAHITRLNLA